MSNGAMSADFEVVSFDEPPGPTMPQQLGSRLWFPMWLMGIGGFTVGIVLAIIRASEVADLDGAGVWTSDTTAQLQHVGAGFMFIGFAGAFAAVTFAIARILGQFRQGGGDLQQAAGRSVRLLKMPRSGNLFILTMVMAMMTIVVAVILHFAFAAGIDNTAASLEDAEQRFIVLEGVRRLGIALFLVSFLLGLGTIIKVLRVQGIRLRQLPDEQPQA
jgi:hypothetical protein